MQAGREGREKFWQQKRSNPMASTTNKEKTKQKAFAMVKHKVKATKGKRSFHDRQVLFATCYLLKRQI